MRPTRILAGGLIAALAVTAVGVLLSGPGKIRSPSTRPAVGSMPPSSKGRSPASIGTVSAGPRSAIGVVRHGLSAWGRFAVTGELSEVKQWFASDGPQYARFVEEAAGPRVGGSAYSVDLQSPDVELRASRAFVDGLVTFARAEGEPRTYEWTVVLERRQGFWMIWTVEDSAQSSSRP